MSLPAREQQALDGIETVLQAGETRLTSMFGLFTRLAADEEKPRAEELKPQSRASPHLMQVAAQGQGAARPRPPRAGRPSAGSPGERVRVAVLLTMLVAALGAAVILSVHTSSSRGACGPVSAAHSLVAEFSQPGSCQSSAPPPPTPPWRVP